MSDGEERADGREGDGEGGKEDREGGEGRS